jgi:hypothetical protein
VATSDGLPAWDTIPMFGRAAGASMRPIPRRERHWCASSFRGFFRSNRHTHELLFEAKDKGYGEQLLSRRR